MNGLLFMLGTLIIEGGSVFLLMWLITERDREASRAEDARRRLAELEAEEEALRQQAA